MVQPQMQRRPANFSAEILARMVALSALLIFYGLFLAQKINFVTADLGRHLKNGEVILQTHSIPEANFYSYTYPAFRTVDHHWGTGVAFFLIERYCGFKGLSVFAILMGLLTFLIFFDLARRSSSFEIAAFCAVILIPCLGDRVEIRPEIFSYFFCAVYLWILWRYRDGKISARPLVALPLLQLLWVNLHVYFFLGFGLCGAFLIEAGWDWLQKRRTVRRVKALSWLLAGLVLASLANPLGFKGVVYPLFIFNNYGYRLLENQSVWFIARLFKYPSTPYFEMGFTLLTVSWAAQWFFLQKRFSIAQLCLTIFFSATAWLAVRNFTMFAYVALALSAANLGAAYKAARLPEWSQVWLLPLAALVAVAMLRIDPVYFTSRWRHNFGLGLAPNVQDAAEFFKQNGLEGPIMNNYDNGGYLIYNFYPQERVFVDNRPEAYPAEFFRDVYVPIQQDDVQWRHAMSRYGFNAIFFYWHDLTPWGQSFIIRRVRDPLWAPVYVDAYNIILLKRDRLNAEIIRAHELPQQMFSVATPAKH